MTTRTPHLYITKSETVEPPLYYVETEQDMEHGPFDASRVFVSLKDAQDYVGHYIETAQAFIHGTVVERHEIPGLAEVVGR